jgi:hypothetical protein
LVVNIRLGRNRMAVNNAQAYDFTTLRIVLRLRVYPRKGIP